MNYKLIVMDLDGTLNNSEKQITPKTQEALLQAQEAGARLVLASGRPAHGLLREAKLLQMERYGGILMSFNGARVEDYVTKEVLYTNPLPQKCVLPIINNARALNLNIMVHKDHEIIVENKDCYKVDYEAKATCMDIRVVDNLAEYLDYAPNKFLLSAPVEHLKQVFEDFKLPFGDMLSIYTSAPFYIEVVNSGITKGMALEKVAEYLGIQREEIIAFGDEMNDLTMLQYAGCGVAMGNAVKPIKLIADEITRSNDEDGIAYTLEKVFDEVNVF